MLCTDTELGLRLPEQPETGKHLLLCLIGNVSHKSKAVLGGTTLSP